jgi:hypothetical protein
LPKFVSLVSLVSDPVPNPSPESGGPHQTTTGGFLNVRPRFTVQPYWSSWRPRVNVIHYLKEDWSPESGRYLELWNPDITQCVEKIAPDSNSDHSGEVLAFGDRYLQSRRGCS